MTTRRKLLLAAAGCTLVVAPFAAHAQARKAPIVIGWLVTNSSDSDTRWLQLFKEALAELGRREGTDFVMDVQWVRGTPEGMRLPAAQLAANNPAVIVTSPRPATSAVARAAPGIPVVQANGGSLVEEGLATSLARPGRMVTGLVNLHIRLLEKHTELLADVIPGLQRVGYLIDGTWLNPDLKELAVRAASRYKAQAIFAKASKAEELEPAFAQFRRSEAQGFVLPPHNWFGAKAQHIAQLAQNHRLPMVTGGSGLVFAEAGALMSYSADRAYSFRRAAWYVDQILQGRKPGDLPIEQPMKFELVINMKTAKALGITIPRWILLQADRVVG